MNFLKLPLRFLFEIQYVRSLRHEIPRGRTVLRSERYKKMFFVDNSCQMNRKGDGEFRLGFALRGTGHYLLRGNKKYVGSLPRTLSSLRGGNAKRKTGRLWAGEAKV